ncbi:hypothetical protein ACFQ6T_29855, partial [Streptomyces sp. NPDC056442]
GCALAPGPLLSRFALPRTHISQADRGVRLWAKDLRHGLRHGAVPGAGRRSGWDPSAPWFRSAGRYR